MAGFSRIDDESILADAAFFTGLLAPGARAGLIPMPVRVDGLNTIAFCVKAAPLIKPDVSILHPVAIIPHRGMIIQDIRNGTSPPLSRIDVLPLDTRQAKILRAAMNDPEAFFGEQWSK